MCDMEKDIRLLWKTIGEVSGTKMCGHGSRMFKGRKEFGLLCTGGRAGPGNTPIRKPFFEEKYCEAVLGFLRSTAVGRVKEGVLLNGHRLGSGWFHSLEMYWMYLSLLS